jgi:hypothetical protein
VKVFGTEAEVENLHDYEIASSLNVCGASISKYRKSCGIKKANGFSRRFERTYGDGAVETFKKMVENPDNYLADVGRHFDFTKNALECSDLWSEMKSAKAPFFKVL